MAACGCTVDRYAEMIVEMTWHDLVLFGNMPRIYGGWPDPRAVPSAWGSLNPVRGDIVSRGLDTVFGRWLPVEVCVEGYGCAAGYSAGALVTRALLGAVSGRLARGPASLDELARGHRWPRVLLRDGGWERWHTLPSLLCSIVTGLSLGFHGTCKQRVLLVPGTPGTRVAAVVLLDETKAANPLQHLRLLRRFHPALLVATP